MPVCLPSNPLYRFFMTVTISLERNVAALRAILSPEDFLVLTNASIDGVELIAETSANGPNIASRGKRLYDPDGRIYAENQVETFLANPKRLSLAPAPPTSRHAFSEMAVARLYDRFAGKLIRDDRDPGLDTGYLVSLGLGLGLHLPMLLNNLPVRNVVIVEQSAAIARLSLTTMDWAGLVEEIDRRGGQVHLFIAGQPQAISAKLYETVRGRDMPFLDGSIIFPHYATSYLNEVAGAFASALPMIGDPVGFLEDEALMLRNAAMNLQRQPDGIVRRDTQMKSKLPAFVIGSGPSIDGHLEAIAKHKNDALIISGGTGLSVLLENGITPDLHCEIENVPDIYAALAQCADRHDLSTLTLVGSVTVDPRVPPFFGRFLGVFRDVLSSTHVFAGDHLPLEMAGPTVTNLACRTAIAAGCHEVYLFGTDLGSVDPEKHHSSGSLYAYSNDPYWQSGAQMEKLTTPAPGNFRETVYTSREFLFTKLYFDTMPQAYPQVSFKNCSDGVRIAGAPPCPIQDIHLETGMQSEKTRLLDGLATAWTSEFDYCASVAEARNHVIAIADELRAQTRSVSDAPDIIALVDLLNPYLNDSQISNKNDADQVARFMMSGSLMMMALAANSLVGRVAETDRPDVVKATLDEIVNFSETVDELFDKAP